MGKPSINGPFSIATLNNQRVCLSAPQTHLEREKKNIGASPVPRLEQKLPRKTEPLFEGKDPTYIYIQ